MDEGIKCLLRRRRWSTCKVSDGDLGELPGGKIIRPNTEEKT